MTVATTNGRGASPENQSPAAMMREHGLNPHEYMTPVQFLIAVFNNDIAKVYPGQSGEKKRAELEKKGGIGIGYRIECARAAAKFIHRELQADKGDDGAQSTFAIEMQHAMSKGNNRIRMREVIIEQAHATGPQEELPPASYPDAFRPEEARPMAQQEARLIAHEMVPEAAGEVGYDPDLD